MGLDLYIKRSIEYRPPWSFSRIVSRFTNCPTNLRVSAYNLTSSVVSNLRKIARMCYILKSVFCATSEAQFEFKGMEGWLLKCLENPPLECHFSHPASLLSAASHKLILNKIAFDTTAPACLFSLQLDAWVLAESDHGKIHDLKNTAFIFFPRWMEADTVCRRLGPSGEEIVLRLDGILEADCAPLDVDLETLRSTRKVVANYQANSPIATKSMRPAGKNISKPLKPNKMTSISRTPESRTTSGLHTNNKLDMKPEDVEALLRFIQSP